MTDTRPTATQALETQIAYVGSGDVTTSDPRSGVFCLATPELTIASPAPTANVDILVPSDGREIDGPATLSLSRAIAQASDMAGLKTPPASVGVWSDAEPAPRWITAAALSSGMGWGWTARWMARDLTALEEGVAHGLDIRVLTAPPPDAADDIPYLDEAWRHSLSSESDSGSTLRAAAFQGGRAVGIVTTFLYGETSALFDLGVSPGERGKGVGSALIAFACQLAAGRGAKTMTLNATIQGGPVYARAGFQDLGNGQTFWLTPSRLKTAPSEEERKLVQAVVENDPDAVAAALANSPPSLQAQPAQPLACGLTLAEIGVKTQSKEAVEKLASLGVPVDVLSAWELGWKEEAGRLAHALGSGAEGIDALDKRPDQQSSLLHKAVERNDPELVRLLLSSGASPEVLDGRFNSTPARWAEVCGSAEAGEALEG